MSGVLPALDLLSGIRSGRAGSDDLLIAFTHPGEPVSKARARFTRKGRAYTPKRTAASEQSLAAAFREAMNGRTLEGNIAIVAVFYRATHQRIDADNLMKLVMDAATKANVWIDDCQVTAQACVIELDASNPRTIIALAPTESTMQRGARKIEKTCPRCGMSFSHAPENRRTYCGPACARPLNSATCPKCGTEFRRQKSAQRYCSKSCSSSRPRVRQPAESARTPATCADCGDRVSRREYLRCSACAKVGRPRGTGE